MGFQCFGVSPFFINGAYSCINFGSKPIRNYNSNIKLLLSVFRFQKMLKLKCLLSYKKLHRFDLYRYLCMCTTCARVWEFFFLLWTWFDECVFLIWPLLNSWLRNIMIEHKRKELLLSATTSCARRSGGRRSNATDFISSANDLGRRYVHTTIATDVICGMFPPDATTQLNSCRCRRDDACALFFRST